MIDNESNKYVCVNCGSPLKSLYKQYSQSVLKLCNCEHCGNVGDKYLEYDKIIILIDLILFNKEAYRHVLFNVQYKSHFKLALLQLMVISFDESIYNQISVNFQESDKFYESTLYLLTLGIVLDLATEVKLVWKPLVYAFEVDSSSISVTLVMTCVRGQIFYLRKNYFLLSGKILFFFVILLFVFLYSKYNVRKPLVRGDVVKIWEAIVCSSFGYFLLLTILIWDDFQREIHLFFITTYITLSQIQALSVATAVPRPLLGIICTFATVVDHLFTTFFKWSFGIQNGVATS